MPQKWPKMTIEWLKIVQLTPKLVILCIYDTFMNFQIFVKIALFLADLWPKNRVFFVFSGPKIKRKFHPKNLSPPSVLVRLVLNLFKKVILLNTNKK